MDSFVSCWRTKLFWSNFFVNVPQIKLQVHQGFKTNSQRYHKGTNLLEKLSIYLLQARTIGGGKAFELKYASGNDSSKSCNPFGEGIRYLPPWCLWVWFNICMIS